VGGDHRARMLDLRRRREHNQPRDERGGGRALDGGARAPLERSFGRSFADVRVHEDGVAEERGALAVTEGRDIHFAAGKLAPESPAGRKLLAHELTHVVQQESAPATPQAQAKTAAADSGDALEREADDIGARAAAGRSVAGAVQGRTRAQTPQHFTEKEHKSIGDAGAGEFKNGVELAPGYLVSYGDMVAMGGDYFETLDELRNLASIEGADGQRPGTRDEVEYVRLVMVQGQTNLAANFSDKVKHAVDVRVKNLNAKNAQHFDNPRTKDLKRDQADKDRDRGPGHPDGETHGVSAGSSYREHHDLAIARAVENGRSGKAIDDAVAIEAFGNHFLTDAFSSGHVRTARADVKEYWNAKAPMFQYNFKAFMAQEVARAYPGDARLVTTTNLRMHSKALPTIEQKFVEMGVPKSFGFGDMVSLALHDFDNLNGVNALVDGKNEKLVGDGQLDKSWNGKHTGELAAKAVSTSLGDVRRAYEAGKSGQDAAAVQRSLVDNKGMYAAERMIPQAIPDEDPAQESKSIKWDYPTPDGLFSEKRMAEALLMAAREHIGTLQSIADGLDDADEKGAFQKGVVDRAKNDPLQFLKDVVYYTPNTGGGIAGHRNDNNANEYIREAANTEGGLKSLSLEQKHKLAHDASGMPIIQLLLANLDEAPALIERAGWRSLWNRLGDDNARGQFLSMFAEHWWRNQGYGARKDEVKNLAAFDAVEQTSLRSMKMIFVASSAEEQQRLYAEVLQYGQKVQWRPQLEAMGLHVHD
jgi:hypothetical protein